MSRSARVAPQVSFSRFQAGGQTQHRGLTPPAFGTGQVDAPTDPGTAVPEDQTPAIVVGGSPPDADSTPAVPASPSVEPSLPIVQTFNQEVCVDTELVLVPQAECSIRKVRCLQSGIGSVAGTPSAESSTRVFQVLQVDLDVSFSTDAFTRNRQIVSNPLLEGTAPQDAR